MKVLLTIHDFLPDVRAGSEMYTYYVAKGLLKAGHQVHVLHAKQDLEYRVESRNYRGIPCTVIRKHIQRSFNIFSEIDTRVDSVFSDLLKSFRPDVLHINHLISLSANIPKISRSQGVPALFTLHDYWLICGRVLLLHRGTSLCDGPLAGKCTACCQDLYTHWPIRPGVDSTWKGTAKSWVKEQVVRRMERLMALRMWRRRAKLMRRIVENTSLFLAPSRFLEEWMTQGTIPSDKIITCAYALPSEIRSHFKETMKHAPLRFGYLGQISAHKGIDVLLTAFDGFKDAELFVYPSGAVPNDFLKRYGHVIKQGNVHIQRTLLDEDKAHALSELDALIVPSIWYENSPLVIHEAFLAGLPIITSNVGGMAELVPNESRGLQFRVGDALDLRHKLHEICENPHRITEMRSDLPTVKDIDFHVEELIGHYERVVMG